MRIHQYVKKAAYKGLMRPVLEYIMAVRFRTPAGRTGKRAKAPTRFITGKYSYC